MTIYASQGDIGSIIALHKLVNLRNTIALANYAINKANDEVDNIKKYFFLRSAILDYNSCYDYVLQIVFFGFDFCPLIKTSDEFIEAMKNECKYTRTDSNNRGEEIVIPTPFKRKITQLKTIDPNAKFFFKQLKDFRRRLLCSSANINEWANTIKHRGGFLTTEIIDCTKFSRVITVDNNRAPIFDSSCLYNPTSFPDIENRLFKQNSILTPFIDYLQDSIFGDTFVIDDLSKSNKLFSANGYDKTSLIGTSFLTIFERNKR